MTDNSSSNSGGIGFTGLLTIVFVTLKLTGYIHWGWLWVLSPIWIPIALWGVFMLCLTAFALVREFSR